MEKVSKKTFFLIWVVLGLAALVVIWFLPWRFQTNDDVLMMWLVSGAYTGTPESYAVFIHPLLSWVFSKLYTFFPEIRWYPLTWFGTMYFSYFGLLKVIFKANLPTATSQVICSLFLCLLVHFALFLQFTIVAGFATLSGFSLLLFFKKELKISDWLFPFLLLSLAILIRWEAFVLVGIGFLSYSLLANFNTIRKRNFPLILVTCMFLVGYFSKVIWENTSDYSEFVKYNQARAAVSDHPVTYRTLAEDRIDPGSRWFYFSHWMMDGDEISISDLKSRKLILDRELMSFQQIQSSFTRLGSVLKVESFKTVFSFILLLGFFFLNYNSKNKLLFFSCWALFFLIFNHFFVLNGRVVILFIFPLAAALLSTPVELKPKLALFISFILFILLGVHLKNTLREIRGRALMQEEFLSLQEKIPSNSPMIMEGYKENYLGINYSMKNPVPFISFGWISKSPFQKKALTKFNLEGIGQAEKFYLVGVDVNEEFFFPNYINTISEGYSLKRRTNFANFILFEYQSN